MQFGIRTWREFGVDYTAIALGYAGIIVKARPLKLWKGYGLKSWTERFQLGINWNWVQTPWLTVGIRAMGGKP